MKKETYVYPSTGARMKADFLGSACIAQLVLSLTHAI